MSFDQEITSTYEDFVNTGKGFGVDLTLRWWDREQEEMATVAIKCDLQEVEDIITEKLGPVVNRDPETDPDFTDEISDFVSDLKACLLDGELFQQGFGPVEVKGRELAHPLSKSTTHRNGDLVCIFTESYRRQIGDEFVRMTLMTADGVKMGFGCTPEEEYVILTETLKRLEKKSAIKPDVRAIERFLASATGPKVRAEIGGIMVCVENTALLHQPKNRMDEFSDEDFLFYEKSSMTPRDDFIEASDDEIAILKKCELEEQAVQEKPLDPVAAKRERQKKLKELEALVEEFEREKAMPLMSM